MLSWVEHEKSFITSGPGHAKQKAQISHIKGKDITEEYVNRDVCDHAACTSMQSYKGHLTPLVEPLHTVTRAVVGQRSSPAGYILYCNIFIIKKIKMK